MFLKIFNSLQIVTLFAAFPFGVNWLLNEATFTGHAIAGWISVVVYFVFFWIMTAITFESVMNEGRI